MRRISVTSSIEVFTYSRFFGRKVLRQREFPWHDFTARVVEDFHDSLRCLVLTTGGLSCDLFCIRQWFTPKESRWISWFPRSVQSQGTERHCHSPRIVDYAQRCTKKAVPVPSLEALRRKHFNAIRYKAGFLLSFSYMTDGRRAQLGWEIGAHMYHNPCVSLGLAVRTRGFLWRALESTNTSEASPP